MRPNRPEVQKESESETTEHEFSENERGNLKFRGVTKKDRSPPLKDEKKGLRAPNFERNIPIPIKNNSNFVVRTIWTIILLVGFIVIIFAGHIYCAGLVLLITVGIFKEVLSLKRNHEKDSRVPFSASLNYYFFGISVFFFYGRVIPHKLTRLVLTSPFLQFILTYHNIISFMLWVVGFLGFVLSLKRGFYRYQFRQFGWTHITCFLIVSQTSAIVTNIFEGLIWFILPSLLVICNDIFAYIFGVKFGRTPLIELSPKKTWEGFIGGLLSTLLFAFFFSRIFLERSYLLCPQTELAFSPFSAVNCEISNVFHPFHINLPPPFRWLGLRTMPITEFQIHSIILGTFASLFSPFGGFFASGFKRAIKIKDFATTIPGHGGITDRMDCQILMGTFSYLYVSQIVFRNVSTMRGLLRFVVNLSTNDQIVLFNELQQILLRKTIINATSLIEL